MHSYNYGANTMKIPVPTSGRTDQFHFRVSLVKSGLRIIAGVTLIAGSMFSAGVLLILAEILGIVEEL